jgi:hypothetical protein
MMKTASINIFVLTLLLCLSSSATAEISMRTGFTYENWSSDKNDSGSQIYVPLQAAGEHDHYSWSLKAGYARTDGEIAGESGTVAGILDTQVGGAYTLRNFGGIDWLLGIDFNLPTGRTRLSERDLRVMIDPDLVSIVSPGQGFNVNPYLSLARNWGNWTIGLGAGYAFQGAYDYSDYIRDYNPGDILTLAAQLDYNFAEIWQISLQAQYATFGKDQVRDQDLLRKGDTWIFGFGVRRVGKELEVGLTLQTVIRESAQTVDGSGDLVTESRDSQGDEWLGQLQARYYLRPETSLTAGVSYLYFAANDYARSAALYSGERKKLSISVGIMQRIASNLDLDCILKGFTMEDDPNWMHRNEERSYTGWSITAGLSRHF